MRRFSLILGIAVAVLLGFVAMSLKHGFDARRRAHSSPTPNIRPQYDLAASAWRYSKDDPQTNKPVVRLVAQAIRATHDPSTFELETVSLRLFDHKANNYTYVKSTAALFDERTGILKSSGAVHIVTDVPSDQNAEDAAVTAKHVRIETTGIAYETKTGKAATDQPATFTFPNGGGRGVGAEYDPNTRVLHLKSQVALDWVGHGPVEKKLHVETTDLVYKELERKVYLTPTARLQREQTTIEAGNVVVELEDGRLHQIDGEHGAGANQKEDRRTTYAADHMHALFNENGTLVNLLGDGNARVESQDPNSKTTLTGAHADLRFAVVPKQAADGGSGEDSQLHLVMADGNAVAESVPVPPATLDLAHQLADTRILRSAHIDLEMQEDGQTLKEIRTPGQAQVEFKPNRPAVPHRVIDASHVRVLYGKDSYVDRFLAWNVQTRTDKVALVAGTQPAAPPAPAYTWSDQMVAVFEQGKNQVAQIEQTGNFRYQEGQRRASASAAHLEQQTNRMTLSTGAHILDENGSTDADQIVTDQNTGNMDAAGHVVAVHAADKNQKPGTSMLDATEPMQARADHMTMREKNTAIRYEGHALLWQGPNRTSADTIDIDRDDETLHAIGNVTSELLDNRDGHAQVFTLVHAPELSYSDVERKAVYQGGVKLTRDKMIVTSRNLTAFLTPKQQGSDDSSLDHAIAEGDVSVFDEITRGHTRTGTGERCDYNTKEDRVVISGPDARVVDSVKGVSKGTKLTYYNNEDRMLVDSGGGKPVFTEMVRKKK